MKYFFPILLLFSAALKAQTRLQFSQSIMDAKNKWVAYPPDKDSTYIFGFLYLDPDAGMTLNYEGSFKILPSGIFSPQKREVPQMKVRLQPNNIRVALIPEDKFSELKIPAVPDWLKNYQRDTNAASTLYSLGFNYNLWGDSKKALVYLYKAKNSTPAYKGLNTEIAYAYNALGQYDSAEAILAKEIEIHPSDDYITKEYIYNAAHNDHIAQAIRQYSSITEQKKDYAYQAESCINIMYYYYRKKEPGNFNQWFAKFQKCPVKESDQLRSANAMREQLEGQPPGK